MGKRIVTEADIYKAVDSGKTSIKLKLCECIITPSAQDKAEEMGVTFIESSIEDAASKQACSAPAPVASVAPAAAPAASVQAACSTSACPEADQVVTQVCALLKDKLPASVNPEVLESVVRRVVVAKLGDNVCCETSTEPAAVAQAATDSNGICFIEGQRLQKQGSNPVPVDEQVFIADAIGACDDAKLAGGYMEWERSSFTRTVECPEIGIILDGELHLTIGGETKIGKAGDMMYFPEGVDVTYSTPTSVRIACVNNIL